MLRMLGAAQKREVKATQNLSIIVLFFMICWIPLYTINCVIAFCRQCEINETFMLMCIILSHANSAGNPILYAYHLKDFREALKNFLCGLIGKGPGTSALANRTSIVSNVNNCGHQFKHYSLRESRLVHSSQNRRYIESPIYYKKATKSMSLPTSPKLIEIVPNSINLAAASTAQNRTIWRISETAIGEDNSNSPNPSSESRTHPSPSFQKVPSSSSSAKNGSYLNDVNYDEDDDVFLDDTLPITDINIIPTIVRDNKYINTERKYDNLSSSSPQLSQNLFLVESELKELEKRHTKTISISNVDNLKPNGKRRFKLSLSGDVTSSPTKSTRVSPLKVVSEFLWSKQARSLSLSDDSNMSAHSRRRNGLIHKNKHSVDY